MAETLTELVAKITVDQAGLSSGLDKATNSISGFVSKNSQAIRGVGLAMTGIGASITGALGLSVKAAVDFESSMREVNSMMGLSNDEFTDFSEQVQKLATDLGVDATGAAEALYQAISAGIPKDNAIDFLAIATKAAIAGVTDTETAVDGLTTVINAFKLPLSDTQKVADIMFQTVKGGKTTFEELSASMFNVAPIAAASGVSFQEVSAALATMTKQGVPTAQATTQLRQAMVALQKPTEAMYTALEQLGYSSGQALVEEKGLGEAIAMVSGTAEGNNALIASMFGSVEALGAVLAITGDNADMFAADLNAMAKATEGAGAATDAYNLVNEGSGRQFEMMMAQVKSLSIDVGQMLIPVLKSLIETIKPVVEWIINWMQEHPELAKVIVLVAGVVGVLMTALGPLLIALPTLTTAVGAIIPVIGFAAGGFGAILGALLGPIGLVVAAVAALGLAAYLIYDNWEAIAGFFSDLWDSVYSIIKQYWEWILLVIFPIGGVVALFAKYWDPITGFFGDIWERVAKVFKIYWTWIGDIVGGALDVIRSSLQWVIDAIKWMLDKAGDVVGFAGDVAGAVGGGAAWLNSRINPFAGGATGGTLTKGGWINVGERGPELVNLPQGAQIIPNHELAAVGGGGGNITINVAGSVWTERDLVEVIRTELIRINSRNTGIGF